jgi:hypothetical protein
MYCSASLFLKKWKLHSFGMNTSCTEDWTKFWVPIPYLKNSNSSVAGEDPEGVNFLFSRCEKRYFVSETVWLPMILDCWFFVDVFLFCARFPLTKLLTKIGFFVTRKGPRTHVIDYSSFVKELIDSKNSFWHSLQIGSLQIGHPIAEVLHLCCLSFELNSVVSCFL